MARPLPGGVGAASSLFIVYRNGFATMPIRARLTRLTEVGALGASLVVPGVLLASGAQAYDTGHSQAERRIPEDTSCR